jgi:hypothetical protein
MTETGAAGHLLLDRRAFDRTVRAEYTAILGVGLEQCATSLALIEKLAGIGRHGFRFGVTTVRTCNRRVENDRLHCFSAFTEDGYPAFLVASVNCSGVTVASSNSTVAVLLA